MCLTNMFLHGIGCWLLITLYKKCRRKTPQKIIMIHLAVIELLRSIIHLFHEAIDIATVLNGERSEVLHEIHTYIQFLRNVGFLLQFFCIMFSLTIDRLLGIQLGIRYPLFCTNRRMHKFICSTWFVNINILIAFALVYRFTGYRQFVIYFYFYIDVILGIIFLTFSIFTYIYIFVKYKNSSKRLHRGNGQCHNSSILRNTNYSLSVWIVCSFLVLYVIPDILYTALSLNHIKMEGLFIYIGLSKILSDSLDAVLYIFLQKRVRDLLKKKLHCFFSRDNM